MSEPEVLEEWRLTGLLHETDGGATPFDFTWDSYRFPDPKAPLRQFLLERSREITRDLRLQVRTVTRAAWEARPLPEPDK